MATEDTKERLLAAAGAVFGEKGFEAATVREICQAAEANLAAVNYYFGDKERLYIESVKRAQRLRVEQVPMPEWPPDAPAAVKLRKFIETMIERIVGEPESSWHVKLMMREVMHPTAACAELVQDYIRPHFELLQQIVQELAPHELNECQRHLMAFSIIGQCIHFRIGRPIISLLVGPDEFATYTPAQLADHITRFSLAALGAAGAAAKEVRR